MYFVSSEVIFIVTPPTLSTIFATALKLTVTYSVMFKSKFVFRVLSAKATPPYEYACVTLSSVLPGICKYVSLYTDTNFTSFVSLFILAIIIQSLLFPVP
ncbi:hypothetical protein D3C72_1173200 [compost metagenome]